jgi:ferredoxin
MDELRNRAKELLESNTVQLIIGYEQGNGNKTRAVFIEKPDHVSKLIFDSRCIQNLAVYLTKAEVKKKGKPAIVAPVPVLRSIIQLAAENQLTNSSLVVLGITPDSKLIEFKKLEEIENFLEQFKIEIEARDKEILEKLDQMTPEERWKFWIDELSPCFKCYACRAACPLCYCTRCTVDDNQPQWVPVASHQLGNLEWHIMRAMHLAGRCTDCGACADACPIAIPLNLLTKKMMEDMKGYFGGYKPSLKSGNLMSTFKPDDKETFIH